MTQKLSEQGKSFSFREWGNSGHGKRGSSFTGQLFKAGVFFIGLAILATVLILAFPSGVKLINDGFQSLEHLLGGS